MPVRTTVVGSWWLHPEMEQDLGCHHAGKPKGKRGRPQSAVLNRAAAKAALLWFSSLHGRYCCRDRQLGPMNGPASNITPTISLSHA
jgi:hypothetical protein